MSGTPGATGLDCRWPGTSSICTKASSKYTPKRTAALKCSLNSPCKVASSDRPADKHRTISLLAILTKFLPDSYHIPASLLPRFYSGNASCWKINRYAIQNTRQIHLITHGPQHLLFVSHTRDLQKRKWATLQYLRRSRIEYPFRYHGPPLP